MVLPDTEQAYTGDNYKYRENKMDNKKNRQGKGYLR